MGTKTSRKVKSYVKTLTLSYLQTIQVLNGAQTADRLGGVTGQSSFTTSGSESKSSGINPFFSTKKKKTVSQSFADSGWYINQTWLETFWDKARYAIGIKDIGIYNFTYAETSEIISTEFSTPRPIRKITLIVDESIPDEFIEIDSQRPWIEYFFRLGDEQWTRISPLNSSQIRYNDNDIVPKIFNVNLRIPESERQPTQGYVETEREQQQIRFRAVLNRPTEDELADADTFTPILKSYRFKLSVENGLVT